ncbi:hypothetical protein EUTSA_v10027492mg [Eutrema salsugineum]|uniref:F-box domain-containing protein n=1 Tax=Eutrema salsugineum TaxID=72664 RepID=V4P6G6_EUTSA|nr:hypothetical protein EUTSA_v10027492mg [Eutrema salsugineum]
MEKKKHNPESHECLRQDTSKSWSDLPLDLLNSVFERLSFANFQRAKSVCSSWYSASRQCVPKNNHIPWLILLPEDSNNNSSSCTLFNPEEKDKLYRTQDLGLEIAKSICIATYGSCLLMQNNLHNLYIVNLFTYERINLPPVESQIGTTKIQRTKDDQFLITSHNGEESHYHVVSWGLGRWCVVYSKKGANSWNQIPVVSECCDLVYKDHKLYFLSYRARDFRIFDFSGETPQETFRRSVSVEMFCHGRQLRKPSNHWRLFATKLVVTVTGDVLKVEQLLRPISRKWSFRVFKVVSSSGFVENCDRIYSLGDGESMLLDQGITVLANETDGLIRNSIYFSVTNHENNTNDNFLFNLMTRKMESLHKFDSSSVQSSRTRWFLPIFTHTLVIITY